MTRNAHLDSPATGAAAAAMWRWLCQAAGVLAVSTLLVACGGSDGAASDAAAAAPPLAVLTSITVTPADVKVGVGLTQTVTALARDQFGAVMPGVAFTWASSNAAVAAVAGGVVTGVSAGSVGITASSGGVSSTTVAITAVAIAKGTVSVDKASVFLTGSGQTARLQAQVYDAQGVAVPGGVRWTSSAPDKVSVDANGQVQALTTGSALITADAGGGVASAPTLAIVATPTPGALLVTNAQVVSVGPILRTPGGGSPGVGSEYEVTLKDIAAPPAPGTVILAAESAPVAGKVVASRGDVAGLVVTVAMAPLHELLADYDIRMSVDLSKFGVDPVPDAAAPPVSMGRKWSLERSRKDGFPPRLQDSTIDPFRVWKCDASIKPQLVGELVSLSFENSLKLTLDDRPGYSRHALEGTAALVGTAGLKLKAGFSASGRCDAQAQIRIPIFGWFSVIVMPAVRFGLGAALNGEITLVQGELSVEGRVGAAPVLGWECGGAAAACQRLATFDVTDKFKTTTKIPTDNNGMQANVSAHFFVVAGLDASVFLGAGNASLVEGRIGPKQSFDLAFEEDQASRDDYASSYDLKFAGVIEPGAAMAKAIELLVANDTAALKFKIEFSSDISESPKGTFTVSKAKVRPDSPVDFTVDLTPTTSLEYWQIGYNVTGLQIYRRVKGQPTFEFWKAMNQIASNRATYRWTPTAADAGTYEFAAFVNTQIDVPLLEVEKNSVREVEVSCFPAQASGKPVGDGAPTALACVDSWVGTATYIAKTPGLPTANIATTAAITWTAVPAESTAESIAYRASGTFTLAFGTPPGLCVISVSPSTFTITDDPRSPSRLRLFKNMFGPPTYSFAGAQLVTITTTASCPEPVVTTSTIQVVFAFGSGPYTGQATLAGSIEDAATTASWSFSRP